MLLLSVLETWQLASVKAQHLREQDRTQELFIAQLQTFRIVITFITWCTSQSVSGSAEEILEERELWHLWVTGSYLLGLISLNLKLRNGYCISDPGLDFCFLF